ncbi:hypothetical protein TRFO_08300 [Tritrichomonas foetus]|uniref:Initiator binding domain-containing protein n=1 Tax=Tritrichomonas foetus TaxID=1144522 RepID=A0A1J4JQZ2_9EUKA|nr:hypothetical protein TRFO_08300 [Tritrichomonas foetus]|eukprot:OHS99668.1 hypothetical protein TRFO_08300 [Tritrichomonas foetus]
MTRIELPTDLSILTAKDRVLYMQMKVILQTHLNKNHRNHRVEKFQEVLNIVKAFCVRNDSHDWRRFLVCGICWIDSNVGISIRRFSKLLNRCKSSVNGSLQKIGYKSLQGHVDGMEIIKKIPYLKDNPQELREWTVRVRNEKNTNINSKRLLLPIPIIKQTTAFSNQNDITIQINDAPQFFDDCFSCQIIYNDENDNFPNLNFDM